MSDADDHAGALPELKPIRAKLTSAEKRERQRLHVKRTYYRKLHLMQGLRDEVWKLEDAYGRLLTEKVKRSGPDAAPVPQLQPAALAHAPLDGDRAELLERYDELCRAKQRLRAENDALRSALQAHEQLALQLQSLMIEEHTLLASTNRSPAGSPSAGSGASSPAPGGPPVSLRFHIDAATCHEIARTTFAEMQRFRESHGLVSSGVSVFGWRDKRLIQGDRFKFSMSKLFPNITPFELSLRGWSLVISNHLLASLYSSAFNVEIYTLQRVDDDNEIRFRVMRSADGRHVVHTLFLASRFESPLGFTFIIRSLDHTHWLAPFETPPGVVAQWTDYYNWTIFEGHGEDEQHSKIEFGGETRRNPVAGPDVWMLEILSFMLRWESIVIGPVFSLCA